jgi:putative peptide zinc metalloprotease protein
MNRTHTIHNAHIVREVPAGDEYLPSKALAMEGGGAIATDPRDTKGPRTLQRMFQFDIILEDAPHFAAFGQRALVRFEHAPQPLGVQWYRSIRLLFLSRFSV